MKNIAVISEIDSCRIELEMILASIPLFGVGGSIISFLTKFAIIRSCGSIERSFKIIVYEKASITASLEVKKYLENTIIESSINPSLDNINKLLSRFGGNWQTEFKNQMRAHSKKEKDSLQSLVDLRNEFAHGGNPTATAISIKEYFEDSIKILEVLDRIIS